MTYFLNDLIRILAESEFMRSADCESAEEEDAIEVTFTELPVE